MFLAIAVVSTACDLSRPPADHDAPDVIDLEQLPVFRGTVDLEIGNNESSGHVFVDPRPLGEAADGSVFVLDRSLRDVRRFDSSGSFAGYVVRPGEGPGEMRYSPPSFGIDSTHIWFSEQQTGQIHYVPHSGGASHTVRTGFSLTTTGVVSTVVSPAPGGADYHARLSFPRDSSSTELRPWYKVRVLKSHVGTTKVLYEYDIRSPSLHFDRGGTRVRYWGPPDGPVVEPIGADGFIRIDRPAAAPDGAPIHLELHNAAGNVVRTRRFLVPSAPLTQSSRDSIESAITNGATWDHARSLPSGLRTQIRSLVSGISDWRPAFDHAVVGDDGSSWLRLSGQSTGGERTWLVVDSSFSPQAQIQLPEQVTELVPFSMEKCWATLAGENGVLYVARIAIGPSSRAGQP